MTLLRWALLLVMIAGMTWLGARFLYGYGHTHSCPTGRVCVTEQS
jgi:hypothetical protein